MILPDDFTMAKLGTGRKNQELMHMLKYYKNKPKPYFKLL